MVQQHRNVQWWAPYLKHVAAVSPHRRSTPQSWIGKQSIPHGCPLRMRYPCCCHCCVTLYICDCFSRRCELTNSIVELVELTIKDRSLKRIHQKYFRRVTWKLLATLQLHSTRLHNDSDRRGEALWGIFFCHIHLKTQHYIVCIFVHIFIDRWEYCFDLPHLCNPNRVRISSYDSTFPSYLASLAQIFAQMSGVLIFQWYIFALFIQKKKRKHQFAAVHEEKTQ